MISCGRQELPEVGAIGWQEPDCQSWKNSGLSLEWRDRTKETGQRSRGIMNIGNYPPPARHSPSTAARLDLRRAIRVCAANIDR